MKDEFLQRRGRGKAVFGHVGCVEHNSRGAVIIDCNGNRLIKVVKCDSVTFAFKASLNHLIEGLGN